MEVPIENQDEPANRVQVRNYRQGEEMAIRQVYLDAITLVGADKKLEGTASRWALMPEGEADWIAMIRKKRPYVAEVAGQLAGFITMTDKGRIEDFFVSPVFFNQGVGSALIDYAEQIARRRQLPELSTHAVFFVESQFEEKGFVPVTRRNYLPDNQIIPGVLMVKRLSG